MNDILRSAEEIHETAKRMGATIAKMGASIEELQQLEDQQRVEFRSINTAFCELIERMKSWR